LLLFVVIGDQQTFNAEPVLTQRGSELISVLARRVRLGKQLRQNEVENATFHHSMTAIAEKDCQSKEHPKSLKKANPYIISNRLKTKI
jgi:hypothetical protein